MLGSEQSPSSHERKASMKVKKPPPLKKRQTKPCKFFQFGRCSNTVEECNFAHVFMLPGLSLSTPIAMSPTAGIGGVCRYYTVGHCPSESVCGMRHIPDMNALGAQLNQIHLGLSPTLSPAPYTGTFAYPSPYTPYPPYYSAPWSQSTWGEQSPAPTIGNGAYSTSGHNYLETDSPSVSISASTDSSALSRLDTPADGGPVGALGLTGIDKTATSGFVNEASVVNAYSPHDHDDCSLVTEDPQFHQHQSQIEVMDREHNSATSGYGFHMPSGGYSMSQTPSWDAGGVYYYSQVTRSSTGVSVTRNSSCASTRSKSASRMYKTKPCRYFNAGNGCPNGDNCTFIHDASIPPVPSIVRSDSKSPTSSGNGDDNAILSPVSIDKLEYGENVEKGISQAKDTRPGDNKEKNFFPITWRVIGGGVLIGGKRPENPGGDEQRGVESYCREHMPRRGRSTESHGNGVDDVVTEKKDFLKFTVAAPRPRSSSASTPIDRPRTVIGVRRYNDNLFSAESP